ncbi:MAG: poly(A) polymerase [Desulfobulbaceae bacterium]|nr:poly(A) polymerase [Desulfobulbaceae bacterium]HIJ78388.1 poly(A) polymerase [Deltaproteobacteria bacterium]
MPDSADNLPEPLILQRAQHPISRNDIDREALKVLYRLRDAGYTAYLVGGGVRDLYLGKKPKDFDISTNARPGQLRKLFRNSRIIGKRFRLVQVFFHGNKIIEVSTLRCRSEFDPKEEEEQVLASNNTFGSEAEDAFRRDLTINALFYEIENFTIIDYVGGINDLNDKIIRIVGDPERRITRDPVRIMRALRHAARNGFTIEENTWRAILNNIDKLHLCPVSRIRDELFRDLHGNGVAPWCRLAISSGLLPELLPFYRDIIKAEEMEAEERLNPTRFLLSLMTVADRLHNEGQPLPDHLLIACLMLPWAQTKFNLINLRFKGQEAYAFSRDLRDHLDKLLEHLSINRATRETITSLLANLPIFIQYADERDWPKWLSRKSYFENGRLFLQIFQESQGGSAANIQLVEKLPERKSKPRKRSGRRGSRNATFTSKKGGIFGLKGH